MAERLLRGSLMPGFRSELPVIERATNSDRINAIVNHPKIRPWIAPREDGRIDLTAVAGLSSTVILLGEHGGFVLYQLLPGIYEVHTHVLPAGRGAWTDQFIQAGIRWMFTHTDAFEILTRVPKGHLSALATTVRAGMRYEFTSDFPYKFLGKDSKVDVYSFRLQDWAAVAPELEETGRWLHQRFDEEGLRLGLLGEWRGPARTENVRWSPVHDDMPAHNRYVGLVYHMALGGQVQKGVSMYNRWAKVCHRPSEFYAHTVSVNPPIVWFDHTEMALTEDGDIVLSLKLKVA